jgi:hypothetical protein
MSLPKFYKILFYVSVCWLVFMAALSIIMVLSIGLDFYLHSDEVVMGRWWTLAALLYCAAFLMAGSRKKSKRYSKYKIATPSSN